MRQRIGQMLKQGRQAIVTMGYLLEALLWGWRIVRRVRPGFYLADGLLVSCALAIVLWVI